MSHSTNSPRAAARASNSSSLACASGRSSHIASRRTRPSSIGAQAVSKARPVPTAAGISRSETLATGANAESATVTTVRPASLAYARVSTTSRGWRGSAKHSRAVAPAADGRVDPVVDHRAALVEQPYVRMDLGGEVREAVRLGGRRAQAEDGQRARGGEQPRPLATGRGSASISARCFRFSISASTACWYSLYDAVSAVDSAGATSRRCLRSAG